MIIAATGHRPNKLGSEWNHVGPYSDYIREKLQDYIAQHKPSVMISGMALGVDTIWAELALVNKVPLIAAIPFVGQESRWPKEAQDRYNSILNNELVTIQIVCSPGYAPQKMQTRNEWMVDNSDRLVAVWNGSRGGTFNCVDYAVRQHKVYDVIKPEKKLILK